MTDQETIKLLEEEIAYLNGKDIGLSLKDIYLIRAMENAVNYIKDYKNMEIRVEKLEETISTIDRDRTRLKKERDYYINHPRSKLVNSVKIQYEDGSFETIYKAYESDYTGLHEGE